MTGKKVRRHAVWLIGNYEVKEIDGTKKVECKACTQQGHINYYSSGTTNMASHLKSQHPELYEAMLSKQEDMRNKGKRIVEQQSSNVCLSNISLAPGMSTKISF